MDENNNNEMQPQENNVEQQSDNNQYHQQGYYQQPDNMQQQGYYQQPNNMQQQGYYQQPNNMQQQGYYQQPYNMQQQGYYQQPNNMQQPQDNFYPNMNSFGDVIPTEQPPKKGNGKKIALISVLAVVVIAAIVAIVFLFVIKTPEETVKAALTNTIAKSEEASPIEDMTGFSDIDTDDLDIEADLVINELDETNALSGFDIIINSSVEANDDGNDLNFNIALENNGEALNMDITYVDSILYMSFPEMYDDTFMLDLASVMEDASASTADEEELNEMYKEYIEPAINELKESVVYEKVGSTTISNHNGNDVKCKQYTQTLPTDSISGLIEAYVSYFEAYADKYLDDDYFEENMSMTRDEFYTALSYFPSYYKTIFTRDFIINYYISDKQIVRMSMDYRSTILGADFSILFDYMGEEATATDTYYEIIAEVDDTWGSAGTYMISGTKTIAEKGNETTVERNMAIEGNGEEYVNLTATSIYNTDAKTYDISMSVASEGEALLVADAEGSFEDIEKGESFTMLFDKLTIADGDGQTLLDVSGEVKYGNLGKNVIAPDLSGDLISMEELDSDYLANNLNMEKLESIFEAWGIDNGYDYDY